MKHWTTSSCRAPIHASMRFQKWTKRQQQSPSGKTPGSDRIPAEVWKHGTNNLFNRLHQLITKACEEGRVPNVRKDTSIILICKKGSRTNCENYWGISLLSISGRIFHRILLNRVSSHIKPKIHLGTDCLQIKSEHSEHDMCPQRDLIIKLLITQ